MKESEDGRRVKGCIGRRGGGRRTDGRTRRNVERERRIRRQAALKTVIGTRVRLSADRGRVVRASEVQYRRAPQRHIIHAGDISGEGEPGKLTAKSIALTENKGFRFWNQCARLFLPLVHGFRNLDHARSLILIPG